jgi:hypothetical protein
MKAPRVWEKIMFTSYEAQKNEGSESVGKKSCSLCTKLKKMKALRVWEKIMRTKLKNVKALRVWEKSHAKQHGYWLQTFPPPPKKKKEREKEKIREIHTNSRKQV